MDSVRTRSRTCGSTWLRRVIAGRLTTLPTITNRGSANQAGLPRLPDTLIIMIR